MANPFLVLGGIAVGVITATFGILQVPGWIASAHNAAAVSDLSQVRIAQTAAFTRGLGYLSGPEIIANAAQLGMSVNPTPGVMLCVTRSADGLAHAAVARSASGLYFAAMNGGAPAEGATADEAVAAAGGLPAGVPAPAIGDGCAAGALLALGAVAQEPEPEPEVHEDVITYTVRCSSSVPSTSFRVPLTGMDGTVEWSDGPVVAVSGSAPAKSLTGGVEYTFTFRGTFDGFAAANDGRECIRSVDEWDSTRTAAEPFSLDYAFSDMPKLTAVPETVPVFDSAVAAFKNSPLFNSDISGWDTSELVDMTDMFDDASAFDQPIGGWDTSKVTTMASVFDDATSFNQPLNWDTSNVVTMAEMFDGAASFNQPFGPKWNTSRVENMDSMLSDAFAFNQPIGGWDTSRVTTMESLFDGAASFNQPLPWDTSSVENMNEMFDGASSFNRPLAWDTSKVTGMYRMFRNADAFNQPIASWDTSKVTTMKEMFRDNAGFDQDISGWNVSSVTDSTDFATGAVLRSAYRPAF